MTVPGSISFHFHVRVLVTLLASSDHTRLLKGRILKSHSRGDSSGALKLHQIAELRSSLREELVRQESPQARVGTSSPSKLYPSLLVSTEWVALSSAGALGPPT